MLSKGPDRIRHRVSQSCPAAHMCPCSTQAGTDRNKRDCPGRFSEMLYSSEVHKSLNIIQLFFFFSIT